MASNDDLAADAMVTRLRKWHTMLSRRLLGVGFVKKPDLWPIMHCLPEKMELNSHWHCAAEFIEPQFGAVEILSDHYWRKLVPAGTVDVQTVTTTPGSKRQLARYITKHIAQIPNYTNIEICKFVSA